MEKKSRTIKKINEIKKWANSKKLSTMNFFNKVEFNTMSLLITGIIITIIGIVIHIIYNIVTKNIEDKEVQINEVSQIS